MQAGGLDVCAVRGHVNSHQILNIAVVAAEKSSAGATSLGASPSAKA
jgi:hypothetical protein